MSITSPGRLRGGPRPGLARAALLIAVITIVARVVGFGRVLVFARTVGPTCLGDTYYTANTVPNIVFDLVAGGALASLVVPVLAPAADGGDRAAVDRITSALLSWAVLLLAPLTVLGAVLAHPLMSLLVGDGHPGCDRSLVVDTGARMLMVFMPQVVLYGVGIVLGGALQAHRRFAGPALAPLLSSVVVVVSYVLYAVESSNRLGNLSTLSLVGELTLSVGTTVGVMALSLPLLVPVRRAGVRLRPTLRFPPGVARRVLALAGSGVAVLAGQQLATVVVLRLANANGSDGAVTLYTLAWTVFLLPWAVVAVPIATSAFPTLSARHAGGDETAYAAVAARTSRALLLAVAVAATALAAAAVPAARVLVLGAPGHPDPAELARGLALFAPGLLGYAAMAHVGRALYARGDARWPAVAAGVGWAVVIVADVLLVRALPARWTVGALGLGNSIGMTVAGVVLLYALHRATGGAAVRGLLRTAGAAIVAAAAGGAAGLSVEVSVRTSSAAASVGAALVVAVAVTVAFGLVVAVLARDDVTALLARRWRRA